MYLQKLMRSFFGESFDFHDLKVHFFKVMYEF